MRTTLLIGSALVFLCCFVVQAVEKDTVILSKNPEINKYLTQPVIPSIAIETQIVSPAVEEYRMKNVNEHKAVDDRIPALEFSPDIIANDFKPHEIYNASPYARDWKNAGIISTNGAGGVLSGFGNYSTMLGMGSVGVAGINYKQDFGNFSIQGGLSGSKYNINGLRFNNFGVNGTLTYNVNDWLAVNAYGSYSGDNRFFGPAAMAYMGSTNYGATITLKANDNLGADLGAERYFDSYSNMWKTRPVVAPYVVLGGNKIQMDFGWLLDGLINTERNSNNPTIGAPVRPIYSPR